MTQSVALAVNAPILAPVADRESTDPAAAALARLEDLQADLAAVEDVADAIAVNRRAEALRAWIRVAGLSRGLAIDAAELHLRSERRAGTMLLERAAERGKINLANGDLKRLGVTSQQSWNWQALARLPEHEFDLRLGAARQAGRPPTLQPFLRAARRLHPVKRRKMSSTVSLLNTVLLRLLDLHQEHIQTFDEIRLVRQVAVRSRVLEAWALETEDAVLEAANPARATRTVSCLLCGRERPLSRPPRCEHCNGGWIE